MNIFFTSDLHFGHANIIKYCNRPFSSVEHMDDDLINRWNQKISKSDIVYVIGDFILHNKEADILKILNRLNGSINLIPGNHDTKARLKILSCRVNILESIHEIGLLEEDEKIHFVLCHYAMRVWNKSHYGAIQLYGHSHGTLQDDTSSRSMDVGVDTNNFFPYSLQDILVKMYQKVYKPVDHHI